MRINGNVPHRQQGRQRADVIEMAVREDNRRRPRFDTEPLPGHYPGAVGLPLLKESRLNHLGKLLFQTLYWHSLLPGRDLPFIHAEMPRAGKVFAAASAGATTDQGGSP